MNTPHDNPYAAPQSESLADTRRTNSTTRFSRRYAFRGAAIAGTSGILIVLPVLILAVGVPINKSLVVILPHPLVMLLPELLALLFGGAGWALGLLLDNRHELPERENRQIVRDGR